MGFPQIRMRRLRTTDAMRRLVRETTLSVDDFIYPLFVREGKGLKEPIKSMTDCFPLLIAILNCLPLTAQGGYQGMSRFKAVNSHEIIS